MSDANALLIDQLLHTCETVFNVNWLTYAHNPKDKKGLADVLSKAYGLKSELELMGNNDSSHRIDAQSPDKFRKEEDFARARALIQSGALEDYELNNVVNVAVHDGFLPKGIYVVGYSY